MSWSENKWEIIIVVVVGTIAFICLYGFIIQMQEKERGFCELHNLEYGYEKKCFEIKGSRIIEYPITRYKGRYYFVNKEV